MDDQFGTHRSVNRPDTGEGISAPFATWQTMSMRTYSLGLSTLDTPCYFWHGPIPRAAQLKSLTLTALGFTVGLADRCFVSSQWELMDPVIVAVCGRPGRVPLNAGQRRMVTEFARASRIETNVVAVRCYCEMVFR